MNLPIIQDQYDAGYNKENDKLCSEVVMFALFAFVYSFIYESRKKIREKEEYYLIIKNVNRYLIKSFFPMFKIILGHLFKEFLKHFYKCIKFHFFFGHFSCCLDH